MYSFTSRIRYSETDPKGYLTPESVLDYFQDCSCFQSEDLGVGVSYLAKNKMVWLLSAWQIIIDRYPEAGEIIKISTFPYAFKSFLGFRNFLMQDESGKTVAYASAIFSLVHVDTYMPARMTELMKEKYILKERLPMQYEDRKIAVYAVGEKRSKIEVKKHHLDVNNHVNNGQFIRIAFEILEKKDGLLEENVWQIRAEYKKSAIMGDVLYPEVITGVNMVTIILSDVCGVPYAIVELKGKE